MSRDFADYNQNPQNTSLKLPQAILSTSRNRAIGQSGNRAIGQSGNRAIGQSGNYTHSRLNRVNYPAALLKSHQIITSHFFGKMPSAMSNGFFIHQTIKGVLA